MLHFLVELYRYVTVAVGGTFFFVVGLLVVWQGAAALITGEAEGMMLMEKPVTEPHQMIIVMLMGIALAAFGGWCVSVPLRKLLGSDER